MVFKFLDALAEQLSLLWGVVLVVVVVLGVVKE